MGLFEVLGLKPAAAAPQASAAPVKTVWPQGAVAQLVGANAISCMFDPGYGLERHLPWLLESGPDGKPPKSYKSLTPGDGTARPGGRYVYDLRYVNLMTTSFSFVVSYYGKDIEGFHMFMWNDVRMNGLPIVAGFTAERTEPEAKEIWEDAYQAYGLKSKPMLTLASGAAGWRTLDAGWKLIGSPEGKVIWQATVDSPSYPKDEEPNEAAVLLMVAHPGYAAGRKPLAYFSAPAVVPVKDVKREEGESARTAALRLAAQQVCADAGIDPKTLGSLASDCGRHTPAAGKSLSEVTAALLTLAPQLDVVHQRIDMVALLGELGANTVNYSLLLAAYAAHQRNHVVLYLSNVDPEAARAMLIFPPLNHTPSDPHRAFPEHNSRGQWYAPWWGQRLDGKKDY
jgi:hypothetical protein